MLIDFVISSTPREKCAGPSEIPCFMPEFLYYNIVAHEAKNKINYIPYNIKLVLGINSIVLLSTKRPFFTELYCISAQ